MTDCLRPAPAADHAESVSSRSRHRNRGRSRPRRGAGVGRGARPGSWPARAGSMAARAGGQWRRGAGAAAAARAGFRWQRGLGFGGGAGWGAASGAEPGRGVGTRLASRPARDRSRRREGGGVSLFATPTSRLAHHPRRNAGSQPSTMEPALASRPRRSLLRAAAYAGAVALGARRCLVDGRQRGVAGRSGAPSEDSSSEVPGATDGPATLRGQAAPDGLHGPRPTAHGPRPTAHEVRIRLCPKTPRLSRSRPRPRPGPRAGVPPNCPLAVSDKAREWRVMGGCDKPGRGSTYPPPRPHPCREHADAGPWPGAGARGRNPGSEPGVGWEPGRAGAGRVGAASAPRPGWGLGGSGLAERDRGVSDGEALPHMRAVSARWRSRAIDKARR
jgi:hypothetical protein